MSLLRSGKNCIAIEPLSMTYLFIILLLCLLMYHFDYQGHTRGRLESYILMLIVFICVAGLRYRIGVDTTRYMQQYPALPDLIDYWSYDFDQTRYGRGYLLLNAVARSISDNFVVMQFLLATFLNCVLFRFFYLNTGKIFFALFLYFILQYFNYNFEILRESCAISVFLFGWKYFYTNKLGKYYLICTLAVLFHPSALITFLLPLIKIPGFRKIFTINILTPLIIVSVLLAGIIISKIFFDWIRALEIASMDNYANIYENSHYAEDRDLNIYGLLTFFIKIFVYPLCCAWLITNNKVVTFIHYDNIQYKASLIGLFLCFVYISTLSLSLQILYRFTNYLAPFFILLFSDMIFHKIRFYHKRIRLSYGLWMALMSPFLFLNIYGSFSPVGDSNTSKIHRYYPYASVISKETSRQRELLFYYEGL